MKIGSIVGCSLSCFIKLDKIVLYLLQERHSQDYQSAQAKGFSLRVDELTAKLMISEEELGKARAEISQFKSQVRFMLTVINVYKFIHKFYKKVCLFLFLRTLVCCCFDETILIGCMKLKFEVKLHAWIKYDSCILTIAIEIAIHAFMCTTTIHYCSCCFI